MVEKKELDALGEIVSNMFRKGGVVLAPCMDPGLIKEKAEQFKARFKPCAYEGGEFYLNSRKVYLGNRLESAEFLQQLDEAGRVRLPNSIEMLRVGCIEGFLDPLLVTKGTRVSGKQRTLGQYVIENVEDFTEEGKLSQNVVLSGTQFHQNDGSLRLVPKKQRSLDLDEKRTETLFYNISDLDESDGLPIRHNPKGKFSFTFDSGINLTYMYGHVIGDCNFKNDCYFRSAGNKMSSVLIIQDQKSTSDVLESIAERQKAHVSKETVFEVSN
jgi:hypothetical protein